MIDYSGHNLLTHAGQDISAMLGEAVLPHLTPNLGNRLCIPFGSFVHRRTQTLEQIEESTFSGFPAKRLDLKPLSWAPEARDEGQRREPGPKGQAQGPRNHTTKKSQSPDQPHYVIACRLY